MHPSWKFAMCVILLGLTMGVLALLPSYIPLAYHTRNRLWVVPGLAFCELPGKLHTARMVSCSWDQPALHNRNEVNVQLSRSSRKNLDAKSKARGQYA